MMCFEVSTLFFVLRATLTSVVAGCFQVTEGFTFAARGVQCLALFDLLFGPTIQQGFFQRVTG